MRQCAVCGHKKRAAIEAAIIVGVGNYPAIARQYGLKLDCLKDHKRCGHIPQAILTAAQGAEERHVIDVADLIEECLEISLGSAREAHQAGAFSAIGGIMAGPYKTIQVLSGVSSHEITMSMVRNGTGIFKARFDKRGIIDVINQESGIRSCLQIALSLWLTSLLGPSRKGISRPCLGQRCPGSVSIEYSTR